MGEHRGGTKGENFFAAFYLKIKFLLQVSRNISTGANHGDGVKLCAVYQRIEDPFVGHGS